MHAITHMKPEDISKGNEGGRRRTLHDSPQGNWSIQIHKHRRNVGERLDGADEETVSNRYSLS